MAIIMTPLIKVKIPLPENTLGFVLATGSEFLFGFIIALTAKFFLASVQLAGQFLGFQMGFNMASVMDPQTGGQSSVVSQFLYLITVLIFFSINGHYAFIKAVAHSFETVYPGTFMLKGPIVIGLMKLSSEMFIIALKLAAPIMIALFLSNLALGIVARTVPQVNILMVGFPINISLGLILFGLTINNLAPFLVGLIKAMVIGIMRIIQGG